MLPTTELYTKQSSKTGKIEIAYICPYTNTTRHYKMTTECDCPFCPLIENKLNQCGIEVFFKWKKNGNLDGLAIKGIEDEELKKKVARSLMRLCLFHKNNKGLKRGYEHVIDQRVRDDLKYTIKYLCNGGGKTFDMFKICIRTN